MSLFFFLYWSVYSIVGHTRERPESRRRSGQTGSSRLCGAPHSRDINHATAGPCCRIGGRHDVCGGQVSVRGSRPPGSHEAVHIGETDAILIDLDKHNSISAEVKHASRQLRAAASAQDFRLLWYRADNGLFVNDTKEQIGSTLYGIRMVLAELQPFGLRPWHCAYAGHADFYRFPEIDGVMVEVDRLITLFLNPFSPRREAFASSRIARLIQESVLDIDQAVVQGKLFAADGDVPRGDDDARASPLKVPFSDLHPLSPTLRRNRYDDH